MEKELRVFGHFSEHVSPTVSSCAYNIDSWSRAQTMLEDYKVWRSIIQEKPWVSHSNRFICASSGLLYQSTSPVEWSDLFLNGCICALCESFYIRRCWKVRYYYAHSDRSYSLKRR